jgi:hypothetical protein
MQLKRMDVMGVAIRFTTDFFDVTRERPNDINPIHGESLLVWLAEKTSRVLSIPSPSTEDWGWFTDVAWNGRSYMLGASASDDEGAAREWVLQIHKHRSVLERLLGREKLRRDDECVQFFRDILEREPAFSNVACEWD